MSNSVEVWNKDNVGATRYILCNLAESATTQEIRTDLWRRTDKKVFVRLIISRNFGGKNNSVLFRILFVIWISFSGTDKICLFITVKLYERDRILSLVSV